MGFSSPLLYPPRAPNVFLGCLLPCQCPQWANQCLGWFQMSLTYLDLRAPDWAGTLPHTPPPIPVPPPSRVSSLEPQRAVTLAFRFPDPSPSAPGSALPTHPCPQTGLSTSLKDQLEKKKKKGYLISPSSLVFPTKNILSSPSQRRQSPLHGRQADTARCGR